MSKRTLSPIGDMSFLLIFPRSVSPINRPMESSSRMINTKGSDILQARIFGRGILPSASLMICRSVPSNEIKGLACLYHEDKKVKAAPGSSTRIAFVITWRIAVLWKNGPAPMVVPGIRVVIEMSFFALVAIWSKPRINKETAIDKKERTREKPGDGFASVLRSKVSFSAWKGFIGFS